MAERLRTDPEAVMERARRTLKLMVDGPAGSSQFLREWAVLLERPVEALAAVLTDPEPWARELRQVTPFAGVLTGRERTIVYRRFAEHDEVPGP